MKALIGKKIGMTRVFDDNGRQIAVTAIQAGPCVVVQKKTEDKDGYSAVQLGFSDQKIQRLTKAEVGHYEKHGVKPCGLLKEVRIESSEAVLNEGDVISADIFKDVAYVDITGTTKGRGFQGVIKRHGMGGGRATHGSGTHRRVGSIGMREWPARVLKGKRMPGQLGNKSRTTQNLKVVSIMEEDSVLLVEGAIPGANGGYVFIKKSAKKA